MMFAYFDVPRTLAETAILFDTELKGSLIYVLVDLTGYRIS